MSLCSPFTETFEWLSPCWASLLFGFIQAVYIVCVGPFYLHYIWTHGADYGIFVPHHTCARGINLRKQDELLEAELLLRESSREGSAKDEKAPLRTAAAVSSEDDEVEKSCDCFSGCLLSSRYKEIPLPRTHDDRRLGIGMTDVLLMFVSYLCLLAPLTFIIIQGGHNYYDFQLYSMLLQSGSWLVVCVLIAIKSSPKRGLRTGWALRGFFLLSLVTAMLEYYSYYQKVEVDTGNSVWKTYLSDLDVNYALANLIVNVCAFYLGFFFTGGYDPVVDVTLPDDNTLVDEVDEDEAARIRYAVLSDAADDVSESAMLAMDADSSKPAGQQDLMSDLIETTSSKRDRGDSVANGGASAPERDTYIEMTKMTGNVQRAAPVSRRSSLAAGGKTKVVTSIGGGTESLGGQDDRLACRACQGLPRYNAEVYAGLYSVLSFSWMSPLVTLGFQRPLGYKDLDAVNLDDSTAIAIKDFTACWREEVVKAAKDDPEDPPSLLNAVLRATGSGLWWGALMKLINDGLTFVAPQVLLLITLYLDPKSTLPLRDGLLYVALVFASSLVLSVVSNQYFHLLFRVGMRARIGLVQCIFDKSLVLSQSARASTETGKILTIMTSDATKIQDLFGYIHYLWSGPLQIILATTFIYMQLGWPVFVGLALMLILTFPVNLWITEKTKEANVALMKVKDQRTKVTEEFLGAVKIIKMYAWEDSFEEKITALRNEELEHLATTQTLSVISTALFRAVPTLVALVTFMTYTLAGNTITPAKAFTSLALFSILQMPLMILPRTIAMTVEGRVALNRIQTFLLASEIQPFFSVDFEKIARFDADAKAAEEETKEENKEEKAQAGGRVDGASTNTTNTDEHKDGDITGVVIDSAETGGRQRTRTVQHLSKADTCVAIRRGTYYWDDSRETPALTDVNISFKRGQLHLIVGGTGAGKTAFLTALLGEIPSSDDTLSFRMSSFSLDALRASAASASSSAPATPSLQRIASTSTQGVASVAYATQNPWILNGTFRTNVTFNSPWDEDWYQRVIFACALETDVQNLPGGHEAEIGAKGINLSGGQKQRIALARAVYANADIYMLDEPLSAVDVHVKKHIITHCLLGLLKGKSILLVTHTETLLPLVDNIVVVSHGKVTHVGSFPELTKQGVQLIHVADEAAAEQRTANKAEQQLKTKTEENENKNKEEGVSMVDGTQQGDTANGRAAESVASSSISTLPSASAPTTAAAAAAAVAASSPPARQGSVQIQRQASVSANRQQPHEGPSLNKQLSLLEKQKEKQKVAAVAAKATRAGKLTQGEAKVEGEVDWGTYAFYIESSGGAGMAFLVFCASLVSAGTSIGTQRWLAFWADDIKSGTSKYGNDFYLGIYAAFAVVSILFNIVSSALLNGGGRAAAATIHSNLLTRVLHVPMSVFDVTPIGRFASRFTSDTLVIDEKLVGTIQTVMGFALQIGGIFIIIMTVTWYFVIPLVPMALLYRRMQQIYVASSRELGRLDGSLKAPQVNHFFESLEGTASIRAYKRQDTFSSINTTLIDAQIKSYYAVISANRWLAVRLELAGTAVVVFTCLFIVSGKGAVAAGVGALAVSYSMQITGVLNWLVRMTSELETNIVAVERVKQFIDLDQEKPYKGLAAPPAGWPSKGRIEFRNVKMRYRDGLPLVLKGLTATIEGGEKVGVVGRTGAGKSTVLLALMRLTEICDGTILVDGVDISQLSLKDLRSAISIIPQDPVLFTGSVRSNLDPFKQYEDAAILYALTMSGLKEHIDEIGGLETVVQQGGSNFSAGQMQLLCLARALLKKSRILLLDEATSTVDMDKEEQVQNAISKEFAASSSLTIAHRVDTILDSDRVMTLSAGLLEEYDSPQSLIAKETSLFAGIYRESQLQKEEALSSV